MAERGSGGGNFFDFGGGGKSSRSTGIGDALAAERKRVEAEAKLIEGAMQKIGNAYAAIIQKKGIEQYWDGQHASIERVIDALGRYKRLQGSWTADDAAKDLLKEINSFEAFASDGKSISEFKDQLGSLGEEFDELYRKAKEDGRGLDSIFSTQSLRGIGEARAMLQAANIDIDEFISKLQTSTSELERTIDSQQRDIAYLNSELSQAREDLDQALSGEKFEAIQSELEKFKSAAERAKSEFRGFLMSIGENEDEIWDSRGSFAKYFSDIESGILTANEAILKYQEDMKRIGAELPSSSISTFMSMITELKSAVDDIHNAIRELSESLRSGDIGSAPPALREFADGAERATEQTASLINSARDIGALQALVGVLKDLVETSNSTGESVESAGSSVARMLESLAGLSKIGQDSLDQIARMMKSLASMNGMTVGKASVTNLGDLISTLSNIPDTSKLVNLTGVNFHNFDDLHISKASMRNLAEFLPDISHKVDVSALERLAAIKWTNLNELRPDHAALDALSGFAADTTAKIGDTIQTTLKDALNLGPAVDQISSINTHLAEMKELLKGISDGGGPNGPFGGGPGSPGGPGNYDDQLQKIIEHLSQINTGLQQVAQSIGMIGDGSENKILPIVDAMQQLVDVVNQLNAKEFSNVNVFQAGGASDGANAIRVYGEEARALNEYLIRLTANFTQVVNSSRGMTGVLLTMGDEFEKISSYNSEQIAKSLSDPKMTTEGIVTITGQLREFREAFMSLVTALHEQNVDIPLPDDARLQAAETSVRSFEDQSKRLAETFAEEAAKATAASDSIQQVNAQTAELKIDTPTIGESFDVIETKVEEILAILPNVQAALQSAFDLSGHQKSLATIVAMFNSLQQNIMAAAARLETMQLPQTLIDNLQTVQSLLTTIGQQSTSSVSGMTPTFAQGSLDTLRTQLENTLQNAVHQSHLVIGDVPISDQALDTLRTQLITALQDAARRANLTIDNINVSDQALDTLRARVESALQNLNPTLNNNPLGGGNGGNGPGGNNNNGGGGGGGGGDDDGPNIAFLRQLLQLHEQINVWTERNAEAYRQNTAEIDTFVTALENAIGQQQAAIDQWIIDLGNSGTVTEETLQQLRAAWDQIRGLSNEMGAQQDQVDRWEASVRRAGETYNSIAAKMSGLSPDIMFGGDYYSITQYNNAVQELANRLYAVQTAAEDQRDAALQSFNDQVQTIRNLTTQLNNLAKARAATESWNNSLRRAAETFNSLTAKTAGRSQDTLFGGDQGSITQYADAVRELENRLHTLQRANIAQRQAAMQSFEEQVNIVRNLYTELNNLAGSQAHENSWEESLRRAAETFDQINAKTAGRTQVSMFGGDVGSINAYGAAIHELENRLHALQTAGVAQRDAAMQSYEEQVNIVRNLYTELNNIAKDDSIGTSLTKGIDTFRKQLVSFQNSHSAFYAQNRAVFDDMFARLSDGSIQSASDLRELQAEFTRLSGNMTAAGNTGKTFWNMMSEGWRKFGGWSIVTRSFTKVISMMKQAVTAVKEVDAAMTELKKVTDETTSGYERFYQTAVSMSTQVGTKLSDVIQSAADFARLGYSLKEATDLTEAALVYQNVADGLEDVSEATSSLISTIKAFGDETYEAMDIVDMFNEVGKELLPMPVVTRCLAERYIGQSSVVKCA